MRENRIPAIDRNTAGGIQRIEIPLPVAPGSVNVYLVPVEDGWILVDCGMNVPGAMRAYEEAGVDLRSVRRIFLTHIHPDHSGLAAVLKERTGAPVRMHPNEDETLGRLRTPEAWLALQNEALESAGVPEAFRRRIGSASLVMRRMFPAGLRADGYLQDGDVIPTLAGPMRVIATPGHSTGHVCFYFPEKKLLLAGDHLHVADGPHLDGGGYLESLCKLARLDVRWVMPSHGRPFRDLGARIEELRFWFWQRASAVRRMAALGWNAHQITQSRWADGLNPFQHGRGVMETRELLGYN